MAIFYAETESIKRSKGHSAVAAAAYRAGVSLQDKQYGKLQNYSSKHGVMGADIFLPTALNNQSISREDLWNLAEKSESRKDARVAREWRVNLPHELDEQERKDLAHGFTKMLVERYGVIADCAIHQPTAKEIKRGADPRNYHAHILLTTREAELVNGEIALTKKATSELKDTDRRKLGLGRMSDEIKEVRLLWETLANEKLAQYGFDLIDSRSFEELGIEQLPTVKMGKNATHMEREGIKTAKGDTNRLIKEYNQIIFNRELEHIHEVNTQADQIIFESRKNHERIRYAEAAKGTRSLVKQSARRNNGIERELATATRAINSADKRLSGSQSKIDRAEQSIVISQSRLGTTEQSNTISQSTIDISQSRIVENERAFTDYEQRFKSATPSVTNNERPTADSKQRLDYSQQQLADSKYRLDYSKQRAAELKQHQAQQRLIQLEQQEKAKVAQEQKLKLEREQEADLKRLAFENSIMPRVEQHFELARQHGIEFDYEFTNYSLYRAVKASTAFRDSVEQGDKNKFLASFLDYKNAIEGKNKETDHKALNRLAETGDISLLEKFRQRDLNFGRHYEWNKLNHQHIKQEAIQIADEINTHVLRSLVLAKTKQMNLWEFVEINQSINKELQSESKEAEKYIQRFSNEQKNGNRYNR